MKIRPKKEALAWLPIKNVFLNAVFVMLDIIGKFLETLGKSLDIVRVTVGIKQDLAKIG